MGWKSWTLDETLCITWVRSWRLQAIVQRRVNQRMCVSRDGKIEYTSWADGHSRQSNSKVGLI